MRFIRVASLHRLLPAALLLPGALLAQQPSGTVTGSVRGAAGEPLAGAIVGVGGMLRGVITRGDGTYTLRLPEGRFELRARLIGYAAARESVTVTPGQTATVHLRLEKAVTNLDAVAVIGTRGEERTVVSAPVPIDVLSAADIRQMGRTETSQMIQAVAPSFNFPRATIGDGTDHMRPASLRGLAPDQVLVLVNGKRRHAGALVNLNGFVGRGSQPVDLNAIPSSMIERIEILRDGAAAQYGSDAIAGVINVVLKSRGQGELTTTVGAHNTTFNRREAVQDELGNWVLWPTLFEGERKATDGELYQVAANRGLTFGERGYFYAGVEYRDRGETNRSLPDFRPQFAGTLAPRNAEAARINHRQGDAYLHDVGGFYNAGTTLANGIELYSFGGYSARHGNASGFWRRSLDDRTLRNIYPDGFLPNIVSDIDDYSASAGAKGTAMGWSWDASAVYGSNGFGFGVTNSANVSLGASSPTQFDAGKLRFGQLTTNLDLFREVSTFWSHPLRVAFGGEYRRDSYGITAGEEASWKNGNAPVIGPDGAVKMRTPTDTLRGAPGAQVFPGFAPADAGDHSRSNVGAYLDLETNISPYFLISMAGRAEDYSDFGSTLNGKVAARLAIAPGLALRGAYSTGFRAPTLGQEYFSSTATNFIGGVPYDIKTLPPTSDAAKVLGATPLKPEKSRNISGGLAIEPSRSFSLTVDFYRIEIDDRIVLSENFTQAKIQDMFRAAGFGGIGGARYFTNAINSTTNGVDVVANFGYRFAWGGVGRLMLGYNGNWTAVDSAVVTPAQLVGFESTLFGRVERARIEKGQPRNNFLASGNYTWKAWGLNARTQRYGEVTSYGTTASNAFGPLDQTFRAKWITDVSGSWTFRGKHSVTVGSDNVFDVYPDRNINAGDARAFSNGGTANFGIFPYSGISPFGFNGRFVYARLTLGM